MPPEAREDCSPPVRGEPAPAPGTTPDDPGTTTGATGQGTGTGTPAARERRTVLLAVRSATALHRLLDVLPVFDGDERLAVRVTLVPGSEFDVDALAALERAGARTLDWARARSRRHDLVLAASPKGALRALTGPRVLLPHGAGFNKTVGADGSPRLPSGLDPHYLLDDGAPWADLHALGHDEQVARLLAYCPEAAARATVVGDPTLDRLLGSLARRDDYRAALGTGGRRLLVLTSTWGPQSLLARRPELPGELLGGLPHDAYQLALVLHPNEYSRTGSFDLARHLAPARGAGLVLAGPYEEWAALLVASDAVISDHGSTALYAAALGRPVIGAHDGGDELIPGSPMDRLLSRAPRLPRAAGAADVERALGAAGHRAGRAAATAAFALPGRALPGLRDRLYRLLQLEPRNVPVTPRPLPRPEGPHRAPAAFAVRAEVDGHRVRVTRLPPYTREAVHHLAVEHPEATERETQSAAVVWCRTRPAATAPHTSAWTAAGWTDRVLADHPGCRTAAVVLSPGRCLLRHRTAGTFGVRVEPHRTAGRVLRADPAAVLSAVHAWLATAPPWTGPVTLHCTIGPLTVRAELTAADESDLGHEL
ncbi:translation initiation factor 2 [Streptomyces sp. NPDC059578]|uniref:translation initiation factor 2 n=1 Tax=Streptomyces sp. NPDC059578 TaxID=3346874 RepID=UPI003681E504